MLKTTEITKDFNTINQLLEDTMCFNYKDIRTLNSFNESVKTKMTERVAASLIRFIKADLKNVDFSYVDKSKGDITKIKNYKELESSINILYKLYLKYNNKTDRPMEILTLFEALNNLKKNTMLFKSYFQRKNEIGILLYDSVATGLIISTSYIISKYIDYIKNPMGVTELQFKENIKKTKEINNYISILVQFNKLTRKNSLKSLSKLNEDTNYFEEAPSLESIASDIEKNYLNMVYSNDPEKIRRYERNKELRSRQDEYDVDKMYLDRMIKAKDKMDKADNRSGEYAKAKMEYERHVNNYNKYKKGRQSREAQNKDLIKSGGKVWFNNQGLITKGAIITGGVLIVIVSVLVVIRFAVKQFYESRLGIASYIDNLATFIELHEETLDENTKGKAKEKQKKLVEKLRRLSEKISSDVESSSKVTNKKIDDENKESDESIDDGGIL